MSDVEQTEPTGIEPAGNEPVAPEQVAPEQVAPEQVTSQPAVDAAAPATGQVLSPETPPVPPVAAGAPPSAAEVPAGAAPPASGAKGTRTGAAPAGGTATSGGSGRTTRRKVREGTVVSSAMEKTAVVVVIERVRHPRYAKTVQRTKRLYVHDEANDVRVGDRVRLSETRPLSKLKRWRVERVLERAR
jgi:small subunit ribosomal protein S17